MAADEQAKAFNDYLDKFLGWLVEDEARHCGHLPRKVKGETAHLREREGRPHDDADA